MFGQFIFFPYLCIVKLKEVLATKTNNYGKKFMGVYPEFR